MPSQITPARGAQTGWFSRGRASFHNCTFNSVSLHGLTNSVSTALGISKENDESVRCEPQR